MTSGPPVATSAPIALWAVPRSRSTVFLRVMLERGDLDVVHEPFSYLLASDHFDIGGRRATTAPDLLGILLDRSTQDRRVFFKDTSDYDYAALLADDRLYHDVVNTFMIREPRATVASHYAMNPEVTLDEIGFEYLYTIFTAVERATGRTPIVIDGDDLVAEPEATMRAYCGRVGLRFIGKALHWQPTAGHSAWQRTKNWHREVDGSSGLTATRPEHRAHPDSDPHLRRLVEHHQPFYDAMHAHRLVVESSVLLPQAHGPGKVGKPA